MDTAVCAHGGVRVYTDPPRSWPDYAGGRCRYL